MHWTEGAEGRSAKRREVMRALAMAPARELLDLWQASGLPGEAEILRGPETGLVALRGRIGGGGAPFNFGEATVTRATVRIAGGEVGHAYALGRDREKVRVSAIIDALAQRPEHAATIDRAIVEPLRTSLEARDAAKRAETAATKVDFFTMVRGED